jgi:hypothetical protein
VAADALFREARGLLQAKNYEAACPKLAESYRLDPVPGTLFNLADCEEKQGRIASSLLRWQSLVDLLTVSKRLTDPRLPAARKKVEGLGARVPKLTLRLRPTKLDVVVFRDGIELRGAGLEAALPVDPGEHSVLVRAPYRHDRSYKITLQEGESRELELEPGEPDGTEPRPLALPVPTASAAPSASSPPVASAPEPPPPSPPLVPASGGWQRPAGLVVGGVGLASLIGAGVTGVMMMGHRQTVDEDCNRAARTCSTQRGQDAADAGKALAPVNLALWILGAAGVGAGAYLYLTAPPPGGIQTGLSLSQEHKGIWLQGSF